MIRAGRLIEDIEPEVPHLAPVIGSSNIDAVGYDGKAKALFVRFHNGATWRYAPVMQARFDALMEADSIGSHFGAHIRNGVGINATLVQPKPEEGA